MGTSALPVPARQELPRDTVPPALPPTFWAVLPGHAHPVREAVEGELALDVVHQQHSVCVPVVAAAQGEEPFFTGRVPQGDLRTAESKALAACGTHRHMSLARPSLRLESVSRLG